MKSVFLSFLIFAGVFLLAGSGVLSVVGKDWFHYTSYAIFAIVMIAGICITFLRKPTAAKAENADDKNTPIMQEEDENDRK